MNARLKALLEEIKDHEESGLFGVCAKKCLLDNEEIQAVHFIKELGEYTHIYNMRITLGGELVDKIILFCEEKGFTNPFAQSKVHGHVKLALPK